MSTGVVMSRPLLMQLGRLAQCDIFNNSRRMVHIEIHPKWALMDEVIDIKVTDLRPGQKVTLHANVQEASGKFASFAQYSANADGVVDLDRVESQGGLYSGKEKMGLFWSLQQEPGQRSGLDLRNKDPTEPFTFNISVFDDHLSWDNLYSSPKPTALDVQVIERSFMAQNVTRVPFKEGRLRGSLFIPEGPGPFPGVIDIFGTTGGLLEYRSALLASRGFFVLSLAYFAYLDLPKTLWNLDFTYFEEAIDWLSVHPQVHDGLGMIGLSKGGEIVLLVAKYCPKVKAVVDINGTPFIAHGDMIRNDEVWKAVQYDISDAEITEHGLVFRNLKNFTREDIIRLDNPNVQILILLAGDDQLMDNGDQQLLLDVLPNDQRSHIEMILYPGAGHRIEPPYSPLVYSSFHRSVNGMIVLGGNPKDHSRAQEDAWRKTLEHFRKHLKSSARGANDSRL